MIRAKVCYKCRKVTNVYYVKASVQRGAYLFYCKPCKNKEVDEKYQAVQKDRAPCYQIVI